MTRTTTAGTFVKRLFVGAAALAGIASVAAPAQAVGGPKLEVARFAIEKGVFNTIFAKEMCSCVFVDGLTLAECQERDNLPPISHSLVLVTVDEAQKSVTSAYRGKETVERIARQLGLGEIVTIGGPASARFDPAHPEHGCTLTRLPTDPR